jgi:hypothetical protein
MSSSSIMDFIGGFMAASSAGKLPTTKQSNDLANWLLKSPLLQLEASAAGSGGKLSEHGTEILRDIREIVEAYQAAATEKNGDDILQDALFTLGRTGRRQYETQGENTQQSEAQADAQDFVGAARVAIEAFLGGVNWGGETAHFARMTGADVAEAIEKTARDAKDNLRERDEAPSYGDQDRDAMDVDDRDARAKYEQRMDTVKETGSQAIGAGQTIQGRTGDVSNKTIERLDEASYRIAERAQNDPEYRRAIDTLFSIYDKYKNRSIDRAQRVQDPNNNEIEEELADILGGGEVPSALKNIRVLVERFAGGKSLQDVFSAAAACGADLREDQEVRRAVDDYEAFIRKSMDEPGYIESDEYRQRRRELRQQWERLQSRDTDAGRKWNQDVQRLQQESREFNEAVAKDGSIQRLKNAHIKLAKHIASLAPTVGKFAIGQASWVWSDLSDVVLPRVFAMLKEIPLPRTEYVDDETEFVLENMNLESLQLLPGRFKITNQTSIDVDAPGPAAGESKKDMSNKTRIQFTGVQLKLKQLSFYYHDKQAAAMAPGTVTGLLDVTIPEKGLDVDLQVSLLPTASGAKQREKRRAFHRVEHVSVSLDDVTIAMSKTNHPVTITLFKPAVRARLLATLKTSLEHYIRVGIETLDGIAYDVHDRAQVFADAARTENSFGAHVLGLTSVLGRMAREGRLSEGLRTTSAGFVKDDPQTNTAFAMGTAPQILHGDKHGPVATGVRPGSEVQRGEPGQAAKGAAQKVKGEGVPVEVESFVDSVARKREAEKKSEGWRTRAYELPAGAA